MNDLSVIGFLIFFAIFALIAIWALCMPRERVEKLANLPLESELNSDEHQA